MFSPKVSERKPELNTVREIILSYLELLAQIAQLAWLSRQRHGRPELLRFSNGN
jgi:hypothetical protein